jgi:cytidylate kinase
MVGSGGGGVAKRLAERVGWPLFDREVLQSMAGDDEMRERLYETMDERDLNFVEELTLGFASTETARNDYFHRLTATILAIARQGHAVFLGRAADMILPRESGLRVRMVSLPVTCAQRYAEKHGIPVVRAAREIERIERERHVFTENHFKVAPDAPDRYDITLNLATVSEDEAVHLLAELMRTRRMLSE